MHTVVALGLADLQDIERIERDAHRHPWSAQQLRDSLTGEHRVWGLRDGDRLAAYLIWMSVVDEVHILNLAVDPARRRQGLARRLLLELKQDALNRGARHLFLEVRISNTGAIALYESLGLCEMGRRRNYYRCAEGREDAILMGMSW